MKIKSLLPPLNDKNWNVPNKAGKWNAAEDGTDFISNLADKLKIDEMEDADLGQLSIPDVWAPIKLFEIALFETKPPGIQYSALHRRTLAEWRGLIALYALREYRKLPLETAILTLSYQNLRQVDEHKPFINVAVDLLPKSVLFKGQNWNEIGLLKYNNKLIAFLVPSFLFCPARGYEDNLDKGIPWGTKKVGLNDPTRFKLSDIEFAIIAQYCRHLINSAKAQEEQAADPHRLHKLIGLLNEYEKELMEPYPLKTLSFTTQVQQVNLPKQIFYGDAFRNVFIPPEQGIQFGCGLKVREPFRNLMIKGGIFIDPQLAEWLVKPPTDVLVWDIYKLQDIEQHKDNIIRGATRFGYLTLTANDLFTNHLCRVTDREIAGHAGMKEPCFILPLRPIILLFLSPEEIRKALTITVREKKVTVTLQLSVYDHGDQPQKIAISKDFNTVYDAIEPPSVLSLWPNFKSEIWRYYYILATLNPEQQIIPNSIFSIAGIRNILSSASTSKECVEWAQGLAERINKVIEKQRLSEQGGAYSELFYLSDIPEAILCQANLTDREGQGQSKHELGLLLIPGEKIPELAYPDLWHVGVDFGSTNTSVYYHSSRQARILPISFGTHVVSLFTRMLTTKEAVYYHELQFLPVQQIQTPFLTILEERKLSNITRRPLWTDRISYVRDIETAINRWRDSNWQFNLKWDHTEAGRRRVHVFLSQVILQTLAEAQSQGVRPTDIKWSFSWPEEALSSEQRGTFQRICIDALQTAIDPQRIYTVPANAIGRFAAESVCTALYFHDKKQAYNAESVLTIDIGGGTTDISVWQNKTLIWRTSLRLAGQHILVEFLSLNPRLLEELQRNEPDLLKGVLDGILQLPYDAPDRNNAIEILVNSEWYQRSLQHLHFISGENKTRIPGLVRITEFALAGIFYYIGRVISYLGNGEHFENRRPRFNFDLAERFYICIGGKGSLLIQELVDEDSRDKLLEIFQNAANLEKKPQPLELSDSPKSEVAYGLLVEAADKKLITGQEWSDTILGDELLLRESDPRSDAPNQCNKLKALTPSYEAGLNSEYSWHIGDLTELKAMILQYEQVFGRRLSYDPGWEDKLKSSINDELGVIRLEVEQARAHSSVDEKSKILYQMQPIFIAELRHLIQQLILRQSKLPVDSVVIK